MLVCNFSLQALSTFEPRLSMRGKIMHLEKKQKNHLTHDSYGLF